uniref:NADH dehydrogenase subunit 3 n=1 Tax=Sinelater perroti TaxID=1028068 RepID=UPI002114853A|nr:NADH dehydrogenase subunit 3 [Sinelater perroti]UTS56945.1 NADH dehydrogenase subunit 3 [Sinelater perroti]
MINLLLLIAMTISVIMIIMALILSKKSFSDREKSSPFECGFDPKSSARMPFSLQFFLIAMIFLIFDVEITLLLPLTMILKMTNPLMFSIITLLFIIILLLGLYHEWKQGALNWAN